MDEWWTAPQFWTILGVVIGAILGAAAQVVAGVLQGKRDKRVRDDQLRRNAYQETLTALRRFEVSAYHWYEYTHTFTQPLTDHDRDAGTRFADNLTAAQKELRSAIAQADLEASPAVRTALPAAVDACIFLGHETTEVPYADRERVYARAYDKLMNAMRAELGREPLDRGTS